MSFIYNLIVFLIIGSSLYEMYGNQQANKAWFYSIITLMALTAGLAYAISPDWFAYWNAFEGAAIVSWGELMKLAEMTDMEVGYTFLNKLVSSIGLGYASFLLILAGLSLALKASTIYKYGGYVFFSLLLYITPAYFVEEHVHLRQGIATAITIFSVRFIIERKLYYFLICFAIAFLFHKACVAFILAYWIVKIKFNNTTVIVLVSAALIASITGLSTQIDGIMQLMPFGIAETYSDYSGEETESSIIGDIVKIIIVCSILMFNKTATENDPYYAFFRNIYLFGVIMYFFFGNGIFAVRLPNFYLIHIIFLVPRMAMALKDNSNLKNFLYTGFVAYALVLYVYFYNNWGDRTGFGSYTTSLNEWVPYSFFLDE